MAGASVAAEAATESSNPGSPASHQNETLSGGPVEDIPTPNLEAADQDLPAWRDELSAQLNRYRARRRMRPPRFPSLRLQFDAAAPLTEATRSDARQQSFEPIADRALALNDVAPATAAPDTISDLPETSSDQALPVLRPYAPHSGPPHNGAKIIEFPRYGLEPYAAGHPEPFTLEPPAPPRDQLAEPVIDRPRILEVPEIESPPPALGGITIEPLQRPEPERRPGIDLPLQSASLSRRILANLLDAAIVGVATALFGYIFWKVAAVRPPAAQILGLAVGISCVFWGAYQYLLLVYAAVTPGLRAAGLDLAHFDGRRTDRSARRWRVLASYLSALSLGMGYLWVFLDEDVLCWHDRITRTYFAPKKRAAPDGASTTHL